MGLILDFYLFIYLFFRASPLHRIKKENLEMPIIKTIIV